MSSYVKEKLGRGNAILKSKHDQPLLGYAIHRYSTDSRYRLSPEVVAVLFQHGADLNEPYNGTRCWEDFLLYTSTLPKPTDREETFKWIAIFELFLQYGAYANARTANPNPAGKKTALSVVTETFMEWTPLEAAELHQMLVSRGATLNSALMQKQADLLEAAINYGAAAIIKGSTAGLDGLEMTRNQIDRSKRMLRRGWRGAWPGIPGSGK